MTEQKVWNRQDITRDKTSEQIKIMLSSDNILEKARIENIEQIVNENLK